MFSLMNKKPIKYLDASVLGNLQLLTLLINLQRTLEFSPQLEVTATGKSIEMEQNKVELKLHKVLYKSASQSPLHPKSNPDQNVRERLSS